MINLEKCVLLWALRPKFEAEILLQNGCDNWKFEEALVFHASFFLFYILCTMSLSDWFTSSCMEPRHFADNSHVLSGNLNAFRLYFRLYFWSMRGLYLWPSPSDIYERKISFKRLVSVMRKTCPPQRSLFFMSINSILGRPVWSRTDVTTFGHFIPMIILRHQFVVALFRL